MASKVVSPVVAVSLLVVASTILVNARIRTEDIPPEVKHLFLGDLDTWVPREDLQAKLPYYLAGYDEDGKPVWVVEFGKWDTREYLERGGQEEQEVYKYIDQFVFNILNSINSNSTDDDESKFKVIFDMDGFASNRLRSARGIGLTLRTMRLIVGVTRHSTTYIINAQALLGLIRPILGRDFARVEIYGNNPSSWRPVLRRSIPADQLPEWYGGISDFKPVRVYG